MDNDKSFEYYKLLNLIQPIYNKTLFPYNDWHGEKLTFTKKQIDIIVHQNDPIGKIKKKSISVKKNVKKNKVKGGEDISIIIYG